MSGGRTIRGYRTKYVARTDEAAQFTSVSLALELPTQLSDTFGDVSVSREPVLPECTPEISELVTYRIWIGYYLRRYRPCVSVGHSV